MGILTSIPSVGTLLSYFFFWSANDSEKSASAEKVKRAPVIIDGKLQEPSNTPWFDMLDQLPWFSIIVLTVYCLFNIYVVVPIVRYLYRLITGVAHRFAAGMRQIFVARPVQHNVHFNNNVVCPIQPPSRYVICMNVRNWLQQFELYVTYQNINNEDVRRDLLISVMSGSSNSSSLK